MEPSPTPRQPVLRTPLLVLLACFGVLWLLAVVGISRDMTLPIDERWDTSKAVRATDGELAKWHNDIVYYSANYYPTDLDVNANFVVFQGILGGDMTVDQAAQTYEDVITKWRSVHAADIENYKAWLKSYK